MKRWGILLMFGMWLACSPLAESGPVGFGLEVHRKKFRVEAESQGEVAILFKGGERACVIVEGDHEPVVQLVVEVYDPQGNLVTKDDKGGDLCAVIWYPPEEGRYKVRVHNSGKEFNDITFVIK